MYYLENNSGALEDLNLAIELSSNLGEPYCLRGYLKTWRESNIPQKSGNKDFRKAKSLGCNCGNNMKKYR